MARNYEDVRRDLSEIFGEDFVEDIESDGSDSESVSSNASDSSTVSSADFFPESPEGEWTEETAIINNFPFTGTPEIKISEAASKGPIEYFKAVFQNDFMTSLAEMTNMHAQILMSRPLKPNSRLTKWKNTNIKELWTFLGILFFIGTTRLSTIAGYWKKNNYVTFKINKYMSRDRFLLILRCLFFNTAYETRIKYSKIDYLLNYFNDTMKNLVYPERELSIDESMVGFRGRLNIRQYIKNKRHKYGIKLYVLADPKGLVHRIHMYKGSQDVEVGGKGHVDKVVITLLKDYLYSGHSIYMDNFYNSVQLAELLLTKKTYCTGTLAAKRKNNPRAVIVKKLLKGRNIYRYNRKGVCVCKWKDKRDVLTISTEHSPHLIPVENRRGRVVNKPNMVVYYNKYMKGVDRHDQMLAYYPSEHKAMRWYKKIGIHILQMMLLNSFFLFKKGTSSTLSLESYREKVLLELLSPIPDTFAPQKARHMPNELDRNANGCLKRRKCVRCWVKEKKRKDTKIMCPDCDVGLCLPCYGPHHNEMSL